ncbi:MAG: hypothetical protein HON46_08350 [Gammaproteobacteria bacterium]|mgnify:FL=1|jgi:hypothetical protein|nr:hypothetical protein [Gammaproteobacteria bacterium]
MNMQTATLNPAQLNALQQHIQQAADKLSHQNASQDETEVGSLIYMGNVHDSFPRGLITDPILNSEEIHTWMLMRLEVSDQFTATRIPKQDTLMEQLKCSRPIVSRNLQVLRAMRWITLCQIVRGADGQYRGAIYAQHDEPISLAETLLLDSTYLDFLQEETRGDVLKRLNNIKHSVLKHTDYRLLTDETALTPESGIGSSLRRMSSNLSNNPLDTVLACPPEILEPKNELNCYENQSIPEEVRNLLRADDNEKHHVKTFYVDNSGRNSRNIAHKPLNRPNSQQKQPSESFNMDNHVNNFYTAYCSSGSSFINNKKTTTTQKLRIPSCLSGTKRKAEYANDLARKLPPDEQQYILDFVEDRHKAGEQGISKPMPNPIGFLISMVERMQNGTFVPSGYGERNKKTYREKTDNSDIQYKQARQELFSNIRHLEKMIEMQRQPDLKNELVVQRDQLKQKMIELEQSSISV